VKKNKALKVLTTSALLASLATPFASPAFAAGDITVLSVPTVSDNSDKADTENYFDGVALGAIRLDIPAGALKKDDVVTISLPVDMQKHRNADGTLSASDIDTTVRTNADDATADNFVVTPPDINGQSGNNALNPGNLEVIRIDSDEVQLRVKSTPASGKDAVAYVYLNNMQIDDESDGPLVATLSAPTTSGFPTGDVTIGNVNSNGTVNLAISGVDNSNDKFDFNLRVTESVPGALKKDNETLKFKLPAGFKWSLPSGTYHTGDTTVNGKTIKTIYGQDLTATITVDDDELTVKTAGVTTKASSWEIPVGFEVDDEDSAKTGDVVVHVSGKSDTNVSEGVVGHYGEFGSGVKAVSTPSLIAGLDDQEIGDIHIDENIKGSLVEGRTILLTLPEGARWQDQYKADLEHQDNSSETDNPTSFDGDYKGNEGLQLDFNGYTGTDRRTAKFTVKNASSDNATVKFENVKVAIQPGFTGDLNVDVAGTAGAEGTVTVGKVEGSIKASAENVPNVVIGATEQKAADLVLEEGLAGAFNKDTSGDQVVLDLPDGVTFTKTPTIEVTDGDLSISSVKRQLDDNQVVFTVKSESTKPSKIKVSDISLKVDRTVPQGDITLKVKGSSVARTSAYSDWTNNSTAASAAIAKVATPAPTDTTASNIVFKLNSKTFTVDGVEKEMDAAPLVGWDRAYLPVRFAANALNVSDNNIIWDDKTSTFTIFKGDRVISGKVGDKFLTVNGAKVPMDVPVWRNKAQTNNRVMVPIRYLANALNANIEWNKETSEITIQAAK
jgi:hypothetical protein